MKCAQRDFDNICLQRHMILVQSFLQNLVTSFSAFSKIPVPLETNKHSNRDLYTSRRRWQKNTLVSRHTGVPSSPDLSSQPCIGCLGVFTLNVGLHDERMPVAIHWRHLQMKALRAQKFKLRRPSKGVHQPRTLEPSQEESRRERNGNSHPRRRQSIL